MIVYRVCSVKPAVDAFKMGSDLNHLAYILEIQAEYPISVKRHPKETEVVPLLIAYSRRLKESLDEPLKETRFCRVF